MCVKSHTGSVCTDSVPTNLKPSTILAQMRQLPHIRVIAAGATFASVLAMFFVFEVDSTAVKLRPHLYVFPRLSLHANEKTMPTTDKHYHAHVGKYWKQYYR